MPPSYNSLSLGPSDLETYAAEAARHDMDAVRGAATALVDLVLTDDYAYMDALPIAVQTSVLTPLGMLSDALDDRVDDPIIIAAIRSVKGSVRGVLAQCPPEMRELIENLP
ncbi:hypothetical protein ABIA35_006891 [Catenulispora sp. MAP12-49]|uniref:hypothetical protein n=1 Tax=Catenulispora sp. MAP12-49 TaxID=3156302 RepID=UPI003518019E